MAIIVDRINGQNYADNIADSLFLFNTGTWTVASGSGTAVLNTDNAYVGLSSLKIENNTPASNIVVSNASQETIIPTDDNYQISFFVKKDIALEVREGALLIYKNAVLLNTQTFSIGNTDADLDINDTWQRIQCDVGYDFGKGDDITFQFRLDASATSELTTFIYVDGLMVNKSGRGNTIVPSYVIPDGVLNRLNDLPDLPSSDGNYQLTVSSGAYTWTEIV